MDKRLARWITRTGEETISANESSVRGLDRRLSTACPMSGANASATARSHQEMSGANAGPTARSHQDMSGANASPTGRSHQEMTQSRRRVQVIIFFALLLVVDWFLYFRHAGHFF